MTIGPIPYTAILHYIEFWKIEEEEAEILLEVVKALDTMYIGYATKLSKSSSGSKKPRNRSKPKAVSRKR